MPTFTENLEAFGETLTLMAEGLQAFYEQSLETRELYVDYFANTQDAIETGLQQVVDGGVRTRDTLARRLTDTRLGIEAGLEPLASVVEGVDDLADETRTVAQQIEVSARDAQRGIRDQIEVLNSGFRQLDSDPDRILYNLSLLKSMFKLNHPAS